MNKIRQILAFVRSLLDFLLNLGSHTPQKQPPHDTTDTPTEGWGLILSAALSSLGKIWPP